jgi:gas vesicle protein
MYREEPSGGSFMLGVLTGALVGAGVALLFAPKSGHEMRQQLGDQYRSLADRVGEQAGNLRETASQWRDQGRERLQELSGRLSDRTSSSADRETVSQSSGVGERFPSSTPTV